MHEAVLGLPGAQHQAGGGGQGVGQEEDHHCLAGHYRLFKYPRIPDFKPDYSTPVTMDRLEGQITLRDFFTYCCINCMHILPDLEGLDEKWERKGLEHYEGGGCLQ